MKTYRMNAVMAGVLYFLGTVFGVLSGVIGGEVLSSFSFGKPLVGVDIVGHRCRQFIPDYRGFILIPHDGDFTDGDDGFPLPDL